MLWLTRSQKCLADPAYDGKSFGVICLQGNAQANLIRDLLMDRIGAQKMQNRGLVCGNAYAFQGDERERHFSLIGGGYQRWASYRCPLEGIRQAPV
jgi:hypothetical protein